MKVIEDDVHYVNLQIRRKNTESYTKYSIGKLYENTLKARTEK